MQISSNMHQPTNAGVRRCQTLRVTCGGCFCPVTTLAISCPIPSIPCALELAACCRNILAFADFLSSEQVQNFGALSMLPAFGSE